MADQEKSFQVKIVTPDGEVYSHRAVSVSMRATDGERSVLYNHLPILTTLSIGEVRVTRSREMDNQVDHIALAGGYFEFSNNVATIIADSAERSKNIDVDRAKSARDRAKKALEKAKQQHDKMSLERAQTELKRAVNRISVFNSKK